MDEVHHYNHSTISKQCSNYDSQKEPKHITHITSILEMILRNGYICL